MGAHRKWTCQSPRSLPMLFNAHVARRFVWWIYVCQVTEQQRCLVFHNHSQIFPYTVVSDSGERQLIVEYQYQSTNPSHWSSTTLGLISTTRFVGLSYFVFLSGSGVGWSEPSSSYHVSRHIFRSLVTDATVGAMTRCLRLQHWYHREQKYLLITTGHLFGVSKM